MAQPYPCDMPVDLQVCHHGILSYDLQLPVVSSEDLLPSEVHGRLARVMGVYETGWTWKWVLTRHKILTYAPGAPSSESAPDYLNYRHCMLGGSSQKHECQSSATLEFKTLREVDEQMNIHWTDYFKTIYSLQYYNLQFTVLFFKNMLLKLCFLVRHLLYGRSEFYMDVKIGNLCWKLNLQYCY